MEKIINKILNVYSIILLTVFVIMGFKNIKTLTDVTLLLFIVPVFFYLTGGIFRQFKKLNGVLFVYSFLFAIIVLIADLITVKKATDLVLFGIVLPLPTYLLISSIERMKLFFEKRKVKKIDCILLADKEEEKKIVDESKRKFMKILATTGLTTIILYLFSAKKAQAAFFGSGSGAAVMAVKDSSGNKIDPAVNSPTDGYGICNIGSITTNNYYGYTDKNGRWYVLLEDTTNNIFQYASRMNNNDISNYELAWAGKTDLVYGNFSDAF